MSAQPTSSIDVCHVCRKLFPRAQMALCSSCALSEDNRYQLVRDYVRRHPGSPVGRVAASTGVRVGEVVRFCSDGRLMSVEPQQ